MDTPVVTEAASETAPETNPASHTQEDVEHNGHLAPYPNEQTQPGVKRAFSEEIASKTAFWTGDDVQNRWKNNEAKKVANSRLFNAPYSVSANVRIVLPDDPPLTHEDGTADLWIITAGTATAETDGQVDGKTIRNGVRRPAHAGPPLW